MKAAKHKNKNQSGVALLLTVIISSVVMLVAVLVATIVTTQLKLVNDINDSTAAIYAADSGVEWRVYQIRHGASVSSPAMANGATITTAVSGSVPNFTIKSLGSFKGVRRQFQVTF